MIPRPLQQKRMAAMKSFARLQHTKWFSNNPNKDVTAVNRTAKQTQKQNYCQRPHPKEVWTWASKH